MEDENEADGLEKVVMTPKLFMIHMLAHDHDPRIVQGEKARQLNRLINSVYEEIYEKQALYEPVVDAENQVVEYIEVGERVTVNVSKLRLYKDLLKTYSEWVRQDFSKAFGAKSNSTYDPHKTYGFGKFIKTKRKINQSEKEVRQESRKRRGLLKD